MLVATCVASNFQSAIIVMSCLINRTTLISNFNQETKPNQHFLVLSINLVHCGYEFRNSVPVQINIAGQPVCTGRLAAPSELLPADYRGWPMSAGRVAAGGMAGGDLERDLGSSACIYI